MELNNDLVVLRPMVESDIADRIRWETVDTEWQAWDGPWDYEGKSQAELAAELDQSVRLWRARIEGPEERDPVRHLEICANGPGRPHIGWCSAYRIDGACCISDAGDRWAVGITIPAANTRRKGYATAALTLYLSYLASCGLTEVYTQTWSGNLRMIGLAEKLGFREYMRKPGLRTVRGKPYDGLTFRLELKTF